MKAPKTPTAERLHWLHRQIAYNIVTLAVKALNCRRSPFEHQRHELYATERALATQRNTLNWLPREDRAAIVAHAKKEMQQARASQRNVATYSIVPHNAPVRFKGAVMMWCGFLAAHCAGMDVMDIARRVAREGRASIGTGAGDVVELEAAAAVAA